MGRWTEPSPLLLENTVARALHALPASCSNVWIALSGGGDSVALLHAAHRIATQHPTAPRLRAVHVNHHLQSAAHLFEQTCQQACMARNVPLTIRHVSIDDKRGGIEQAARLARYDVFASLLGEHDVLWLAHHADDQAETFLLRAMRGSGTKGLSAMPVKRPLGKGVLERPLLGLPQRVLIHYAHTQALQWCDDPSNDELHFDRNYLRHHILPLLKERWPQATSSLCQSAAQSRESDDVLMQWADTELASYAQLDRLPLAPLVSMTASQQRLIIRRALERLSLPLPPRNRLYSLLEQLPVGRGEVRWTGGAARLWRAHLYLGDDLPLSTPSDDLPTQWGLARTEGHTPKVAMVARQGGEKIKIRGHGRTLKAVFQEYGIPPWQRASFGVVYADTVPIALLSQHHALVADGWYVKWPQGTVLTS